MLDVCGSATDTVGVVPVTVVTNMATFRFTVPVTVPAGTLGTAGTLGAGVGTAAGAPVVGADTLTATVNGVAGILVGGVSITATVLIILAVGTSGLSVVTGAVTVTAPVLLTAGVTVLCELVLGSNTGGLAAISVFSVCANKAVDSANGTVALFI